jgi:DSF synthase
MHAAASPGFLSARLSTTIVEHADGSAEFPISSQLRCDFDPANGTLLTRWSPHGVPCFNFDLLHDLARASRAIEEFFTRKDRESRRLRYLVLASGVPNVFNVGGDLGLFQRLICSHDRATLAEYAKGAIDVVYRNYTCHNLRGATTIALIEGDALGGGLECALSCDIVVAEKHAKAGFPEVLFNMFPGMGGMSFLARRVGKRVADEMVRTGRLYSADELLSLGLVDFVVETGAGWNTVQKLIQQRDRQRTAHVAMNVVDRLIRPVGLQELHEVVQLWVDCAVQLEPRSLEWMQRLYQRQLAIFGRPLEIAMERHSSPRPSAA